MRIMRKTLLALLMLCLVLTACTKKDETEGMTPAEISEKAMDNFLAKIKDGNYTIDAKDYLKTYVCSGDLVWFDYAEDDMYTDFAVMSVDNESFQGTLGGNGLEDVVFIGEGKAIEAASSRLPNYWLDEYVSEGNIYNLFYNDQLTFVSYEDAVKQTMASLAGYGDNAVRLMEEVYLVLDKMTPTNAHLKAVVNDDQVARVFYDDIDIEITFGKAESNSDAEAWLKSPVYPEARKEWNDMDIFVLDSVFFYGYGEDAVPFPTFASYAMQNDMEDFWLEDRVYIRDSKATEKDMADYPALLVKNGFEAAKEDGKTVYRKLLREEYQCYSEIELDYDGGIDLVA